MKQVSKKSNKNNAKKATKKVANNRKDKRSFKALKSILIILFVIGLAIAFVIFSGVFNIDEVIVEGNEHIAKEQIISFSQITYGKNIFAINDSEIEENVKQNSYVKNVNVGKVFPNKMKIVIEEREIEYMVQVANSYFFLNGQGYILEISDLRSEVPEIIGFSTAFEGKNPNEIINDDDLEKLKTVNKILDMASKNGVVDLITKIDVSNSENYILYMDNIGKIVYIGNGENLNERFLYVKAIIKDKSGKKGEIFVNVDLDEENVYFREN